MPGVTISHVGQNPPFLYYLVGVCFSQYSVLFASVRNSFPQASVINMPKYGQSTDRVRTEYGQSTAQHIPYSSWIWKWKWKWKWTLHGNGNGNGNGIWKWKWKWLMRSPSARSARWVRVGLPPAGRPTIASLTIPV
eukprot:COSAG02_NODE_680_length_18551_cov_16.648060_19_plen_136_part_00